MAIEKIAVIGCGQMGLGIAESAATHGVQVVAVKLTPGDLEVPRRNVLKGLERRVARGKLTAELRDGIMGRLHFTSDLSELAGVDLVIESCLEELQAKGEILARLEQHVAPTAVLASNTSSLRLSELAGFLKHPERFLALHFFNPVPAMKLVEVSGTVQTDARVRQLATDFCTQIDKTPVQIQDTPGYVVNRLLVPYLLHAIETLEQGVASAESIDVAMKLGCGHPMGPLALADLIGLDVVFAMAKTMHHELRDSRYRAPSLLRRLVLAGHLGRKSTRGIYDYTDAANPCVNTAIGIDAVVATGT
ncbi:MAG: 3-hydroxyacyl-CoA dehydrogenase [Myxococcaceae bacterium]|nr:3-hydroxyacyl-CoA dehydrogenase [Myxococcaceae bacterium]